MRAFVAAGHCSGNDAVKFSLHFPRDVRAAWSSTLPIRCYKAGVGGACRSETLTGFFVTRHGRSDAVSP